MSVGNGAALGFGVGSAGILRSRSRSYGEESVKAMIDEARLEKLKEMFAGLTLHENTGYFGAGFPEMADSLEALWKVARAARRWQQAPPGRESTEKEMVLQRLLDRLPPLHERE